MATLTITPASGSITAAETACRIDVTEADMNDTSTYDEDEYPQQAAFLYRIRARLAGQDDLLSHAFAVSADGEHQWYAPLFPAAGAWTVTLRDTSDDSEVATLAVTVN